MKTPNAAKKENNRLVGRTITEAVPAALLLVLTFNLTYLISGSIATKLLNVASVAAIGIAFPITALISGLIISFTQGAATKYAEILGRGNLKVCREIFCSDMGWILVLGIAGTILSILLAEPFVYVFGGSSDAGGELVRLAATYIKYASIAYVFQAVNRFELSLMIVYGYHEEPVVANLLNLSVFIGTSALLINGGVMPEGSEIGAIGIGQTVGYIASILLCRIVIIKRKLPLRYGFAKMEVDKLLKCFRQGLPQEANTRMESIMASVMNFIIGASALGSDGILAFSVVRGFLELGFIPSEAITHASNPMLGLFYGAKDMNAAKETFVQTMKKGLLLALMWLIGMYVFIAPLMRHFVGEMGGRGLPSGILISGAVISLMSVFPYCAISVLGSFLDVTERFARSFVLQAVSNGFLIPLLTFVSLILFKSEAYVSIWLSIVSGYTLALVPLILGFKKSRGKSFDLDTVLLTNETSEMILPSIDVTVKYSDKDISLLSAHIQDFLQSENASKRTAYIAALCMDELATDIIAHSVSHKHKFNKDSKEENVMDVKMIADGDVFRIIIRNSAKKYNPLNFIYNEEDFSKIGIKMAQQAARRITYSYIYKMNVITIDIDK